MSTIGDVTALRREVLDRIQNLAVPGEFVDEVDRQFSDLEMVVDQEISFWQEKIPPSQNEVTYDFELGANADRKFRQVRDWLKLQYIIMDIVQTIPQVERVERFFLT